MGTERSTTDVLDAALRVRRAATETSGRSGGDAGDVLEALSGVIDYAHASLSRWDPLHRRHETLASSYPPDTTAYIETRLHDDPVFSTIRRRDGSPLWLRDVPGPVRLTSPGFREELQPLGIEDGVAHCLFSPDGRYVGVLNVSTRRVQQRRHPARAVVPLLTECLAWVADPVTGTGADPAAEADGSAAAVCAVALADGRPTAPAPISGSVPPELADADSPLTRLVRDAVTRRSLPATLLVPLEGRLLELRLTRRNASTVVVCREVACPAGLSPRELQVLAELTHGRTNREIAERLFVTPRTVATHIEHILTKLTLPNRAAAAGRAASWGVEPPP
ncbi:LuxR C-terminal-related transcriptional regulator [Streptomyces sp. NPDC052309]|uniref:LuxR C-terminal-related transcriptional regulator n=1 Tax=Streptomyces sp. NPDC052309 TaxID=3155421 RepID=UPI00344333B5